MALLYSRDALTEILVQVARVVNAISQGVLAPDLPRAERVAQALQDDPGKFAHLAETVPEDLPEDEPLDENHSEAGTHLSEAAELGINPLPAAPEEVRPRACSPLVGEAFIHLINVCADRDLLKCGRKVTVNMRALHETESQDVICQQCAAAQ